MSHKTRNVLLAWNLALTLTVGCLSFQLVSVHTDIATVHLLGHQIKNTQSVQSQQIQRLHANVGLGNNATGLLITQCELTLDLVVNASRGGWWSKIVRRNLAQLSKVRRERIGL